jgi:uncharacterized protein (DUF1499 family)
MIHYPRLVELLKAKSKTMSVADSEEFNFDLNETQVTVQPQSRTNKSDGSLGRNQNILRNN